MENDIVISLTNLFQYLLSAEIYLNEKINLYFTYLMRNFQINARNKLTEKCLFLPFSHCTRLHLEYGGYVYVKNKLAGSQIYTIVYKVMFVLQD